MKIRLLTLALVFLNLGITSQAKQVVDRYDESTRPVIAKKGNWMVGGYASVSSHTNSSYSVVSINDINSVGFRISAAPEFCYFIKDNLGIGLKTSYSHSMLSVGNAAAELGSLSMQVRDYYNVGQDFGLNAFLRYYIPVGDSQRIAFHVDAGLEGIIGKSKFSDDHTGNTVGTWESRWKAACVIDPGITVFFGKRTALFASVGLAGITFDYGSQVHNQVSEGEMRVLSESFIPDLTSLKFGIDFILGK